MRQLPEAFLLVTVVLLGPALVLGLLCALGARRHPAIAPTTDTGRLLTLAVVIVVGGGVVLGGLGLLVHSHSSLLAVDRSIAPWGRQHLTSFSQSTLDFVTSFGSTNVILAATLFVFVVEMVRRPSRWLPVFLAVVVLGQTLLSSEIKDLLHRVRPTVNPPALTLGPAFPSGHTTAAAACFAAFALVLGRGRSRTVQAGLAGAAMFIACAVGASRVLLGVHWLTDVIGGLALGWAWFALCSIAFGRRMLQLGSPGVRPPATGPKQPPTTISS